MPFFFELLWYDSVNRLFIRNTSSILIGMNFASQVFHLMIGSSNVGKKMICNLVLLFVLHLLNCNSSCTLPFVMLIKVQLDLYQSI